VKNKVPLPVSIRADLADALERQATAERRTKSAVLENHVESFLKEGLAPVVSGRMQRSGSPLGYKIRRYSVKPETLAAVNEAEGSGYSRAYIVEEALKVGLGIRE